MTTEYNDAVTLYEKGEYEKANNIFIELLGAEPDSIKLNLIVAHTYNCLKQPDSALKYFQRATFFDPSNDMASLGLFHCLLGLGRDKEAFAEMRRFLAEYDSEEYNELLRDLNKNT